MSDNQEGVSAGSVALAFLSGVLLGSATAFLFAPQTGRESRERLRRAACQTGDDFREFRGKAGGTLEDAWTTGREFIDEAGSVVRDALHAGRDAMRGEERNQDTGYPYSRQ